MCACPPTVSRVPVMREPNRPCTPLIATSCHFPPKSRIRFTCFATYSIMFRSKIDPGRTLNSRLLLRTLHPCPRFTFLEVWFIYLMLLAEAEVALHNLWGQDMVLGGLAKNTLICLLGVLNLTPCRQHLGILHNPRCSLAKQP